MKSRLGLKAVEDAEKGSDGDIGEGVKEEKHEHVEVGLSTAIHTGN